MTKKEQIINDLKNGLRNVDIAKKYNVNPPYVSRIKNDLEIKEKLEKLEKIQNIIKKGAIEAYEHLLTEEEKEFWRDL